MVVLCQRRGQPGGELVQPRSYEKKTDYYGGFQGNFLKRIAALFPDRKRVLHMFAGKVDLDRFPGDTLDIRPELEPTYCVNAESCERGRAKAVPSRRCAEPANKRPGRLG